MSTKLKNYSILSLYNAIQILAPPRCPDPTLDAKMPRIRVIRFGNSKETILELKRRKIKSSVHEPTAKRSRNDPSMPTHCLNLTMTSTPFETRSWTAPNWVLGGSKFAAAAWTWVGVKHLPPANIGSVDQAKLNLVAPPRQQKGAAFSAAS
ncbi:hypothetical protein V6Z11_D05G037800 [Gossypium hirsutum]